VLITTTGSCRFRHELILDWYDAPIQAVVECARCSSWFFAWLIAWEPGDRLRVYAFRRVSSDWTTRLFEVVGVAPSTAVGPVKLELTSLRRLSSLIEELFGEAATDVYVSAADDFSAAGLSFRTVDSQALGEWARPSRIERRRRDD
jgi:hypothetical protein